MSRFKNVFEARQNIAEETSEQETESKAPKAAKPKTKAAQAEPALPVATPVETDRPKLGRPPGKRSSVDYQSVTTFLHKATYLKVQRELVGSDKDFGDVVDELLQSWLKQRE